MNSLRWIACLTLLVLVGGVTGCSPYVNIPAQRGDLATNDPNDHTVRWVVEQSFRRSLTASDISGPYIIVLPEGTVVDTYLYLINQLPEGGQLASESTAEVKLEAAQIRVRGMRAEVDVIETLPETAPRLRTCYLGHDGMGWVVRRDYVWRAPVNEALPNAAGDSALN